MAGLDTTEVGETSTKCSWPGLISRWLNLRAGNCEESETKILKARLPVNTDPEVTELECWSSTSFNPFAIPPMFKMLSRITKPGTSKCVLAEYYQH